VAATPREGYTVGSIAGIVASLFVGGAVATATIVGVISSQTSPPGESPANVSQPVVEYGSTN
jgi:hypothetical protein